MKPKCQFTGQNGNVFNLLYLAKKALDEATGSLNKSQEMWDKVKQAKDYDQAIQIMMEYVDVE